MLLRRIGLIAMALAVAGGLLATPVLAQPSGNFSAAISGLMCQIESNGQVTGGIGNDGLLTANIKVPAGKGTTLLIGVSLGTALFTSTRRTGSFGGMGGSSSADAKIVVHVMIDGNEVPPSPVTYDQRAQTLNATLSDAITVCTEEGGCAVDETLPASVEMLLSTMEAHHFNFVASGLSPGNHTIDVWWEITNTCDGDACPSDTANATACVGPGVLAVQQVKVFENSGSIDVE
jgi:hypothetical protein